MLSGRKVTISGKAVSSAMVTKSAKTNGQMPRKTVDSGMSGRHAVDHEAARPTGGVSRPISTILTMMMPNQIGS